MRLIWSCVGSKNIHFYVFGFLNPHQTMNRAYRPLGAQTKSLQHVFYTKCAWFDLVWVRKAFIFICSVFLIHIKLRIEPLNPWPPKQNRSNMSSIQNVPGLILFGSKSIHFYMFGFFNPQETKNRASRPLTTERKSLQHFFYSKCAWFDLVWFEKHSFLYVRFF